jgi:Mor family transcriptional regulator
MRANHFQIDAETEANVISAIKSGEKYGNIAAQYNIAVHFINKIALKAGCVINKDIRKARNLNIVDEFRHGMSCEQLALKFGLSKLTIDIIIERGKAGPVYDKRIRRSTRNDEIIAAAKTGSSRMQLSVQFKLSGERIRQILTSAGFSKYPWGSFKNRNAQIVDEYKLGADMKDLAIKYNLSPLSIYGILQKLGSFKIRKKTNALFELILQRHQNGDSNRQISKEFNIKYHSVSYALKVMGADIKRRPRNNQALIRNAQIVADYKNGISAKKISIKNNLSSERIFQILRASSS